MIARNFPAAGRTRAPFRMTEAGKISKLLVSHKGAIVKGAICEAGSKTTPGISDNHLSAM